MSKEPVPTARVAACIAPDALTIIKQAAEIQGRSVSDFVLTAAQQVAERTIEEIQIMRFSLGGQRAFAEAILNPPAPSAGLVKAAEAHRRLVREVR